MFKGRFGASIFFFRLMMKPQNILDFSDNIIFCPHPSLELITMHGDCLCRRIFHYFRLIKVRKKNPSSLLYLHHF